MLNLSSYLTDQTSYGLVALNILNELDKKSINTSFYPINFNSSVLKERHLQDSLNKSMQNAQILNPALPSLRIDHQFNMANSVGYGDRFGYTFFEMDQFTKKEKSNLNSLDKLIVSSQWAKSVCDNNGILSDTEVAPLGVDTTIFKSTDYKPDQCIFLSIGKWEVRKGQDEIVKAFNEAFTKEDNVSLWMMYDGNHQYQKDIKETNDRYLSTKLKDKIKILPRVSTISEVSRIMQQSYCFVSNSKAEAWNMELLEAMACGKYCISPRYSGESEYVNGDNCLITSHSYPVEAKDNKWFGVGNGVNEGNWCIPDLDSLIKNMKVAYNMYESGLEKNIEGIQTAQKFSWDNTVNNLRKIINI